MIWCFFGYCAHDWQKSYNCLPHLLLLNHSHSNPHPICVYFSILFFVGFYNKNEMCDFANMFSKQRNTLLSMAHDTTRPHHPPTTSQLMHGLNTQNNLISRQIAIDAFILVISRQNQAIKSQKKKLKIASIVWNAVICVVTMSDQKSKRRETKIDKCEKN
eukprot:59633_1